MQTGARILFLINCLSVLYQRFHCCHSSHCWAVFKYPFAVIYCIILTINSTELHSSSFFQQLGLDSSCRRREKTTDDDRSKAESSKNNSKFISSRKRKKTVVEAPQPKRRKSDDTRMERAGDEVPEQLHQQHKSTEAKLITGIDNRYIKLVVLY